MKNGNPSSSHPWAVAFVSNWHLLVLVILIILVGGYSAVQSLPSLEDPVISNRNAQVLTFLPGATADRVEALISEPIEQKLKEITDIKNVESASRAGVSVVNIELADHIDEISNDAVFSEIRDRISEARALFPSGASEPLFDDRRNAVAFTLIASLTWDEPVSNGMAIQTRLAEELADRLRAIHGTELVRLYGDVAEEMLVTVDTDQLNALNLDLYKLRDILTGFDAKVPAGAIRNQSGEIILEVAGEFDSIERLSEIPILKSSSGRLIRLGDIADIRRGLADPPDNLGIHQASPSVFVAARVQQNKRIDQWASKARQEIRDFNSTAGGLMAVDIIFDQEFYTSSRLGDLLGNLLLGAGVVFVVVLFVMGLRPAIIISTALPLVASMTLFVLALQGGKLHQMSIFGMIIALGLLIDNAIVVTDEILKGLRSGKSALEAVSATVSHLFYPLLSSTATTILSFLPILLLPGPAGDFVSSIAGSVIIALSSSFLIAMTIIASLAGRFGRGSGVRRILPLWLSEGIMSNTGGHFGNRIMGLILRWPWVTAALSFVLPVTGFFLATTLGSQFFPRTDRNMFEVEIRLPTDSSIQVTEAVTRELDSIIRNESEVVSVDWVIGESFPTVYYNLIMNQDGARNYAHGIITTTGNDVVNDLVNRLQDSVDKSFPGAMILFSKFAQGPPAEADVEFRVSGPDLEVLQDLGEEVRRHLAEHPQILHTLTTLPRGEPKLRIIPDEDAIIQAGLNPTRMASFLEAATEGASAGLILEDIEEIPVRLRGLPGRRDDVGDILNFNLPVGGSQNDQAHWIPVSSVADLQLTSEIGYITRKNGQRINKIFGFARSGTLAVDITSEIMEKLDDDGFKVPPGYKFSLGGETENRDEAVGNLLLYLPVIVVLTVAVLILTFRSVRIAGILLLVAPMSAGFGLIATWLMGFPLSFNTIIGSLGLIGLAFNSSIVVLAAILGNPEAAAGNVKAMSQAVIGSMRHLVSTTLTTMGSFLPLLIFIGGQFWPPLAIVLAGGVGGSTLLALTFTPALYRILNPRPALN